MYAQVLVYLCNKPLCHNVTSGDEEKADTNTDNSKQIKTLINRESQSSKSLIKPITRRQNNTIQNIYRLNITKYS